MNAESEETFVQRAFYNALPCSFPKGRRYEHIFPTPLGANQ